MKTSGNYIEELKGYIDHMIAMGKVNGELSVTEYKTQISSYLLLSELIEKYENMSRTDELNNRISELQESLLFYINEQNLEKSIVILEKLMVIDENISGSFVKLYQNLLKKQMFLDKIRVKNAKKVDSVAEKYLEELDELFEGDT